MFWKLKRLLTHETWNNFEPVLMLPAWKSVIVDLLSFATFGACRWRWGGITLDEWYDGCTTVRFVADKTIEAEDMAVCEDVAEDFGCRMNGEVTVSNRTVAALQRFKELLESGEPIHGTRIQIEDTPDGPLTTVEKIVFRGQK